MMTDNKVFISYNHSDKETVYPICELLKSADIPIWLDRAEITPGDWVSDEIDQKLDQVSAFIAFIGDDYFSRGKYTSREIRAAEGLALSNPSWRLIPVRLTEDASIPPMMRDRLRIEYNSATQVASELVGALARASEIGGKGSLSVPNLDSSDTKAEDSLSLNELSDLELRLLLKGYLEQRYDNLRRSGDMIKFTIRLDSNRQITLEVMREIAEDEGVRAELQHQDELIKVKQRAVEIARSTLTRGLAGQFQAGFEIMMEEDFQKIAEAHTVIKRHFSQIFEQPKIHFT